MALFRHAALLPGSIRRTSLNHPALRAGPVRFIGSAGGISRLKHRALHLIRPVSAWPGRFVFVYQTEPGQVFPFGIAQVVAIGSAGCPVTADDIGDVFGLPVAIGLVVNLDPLEFDLPAGTVAVRKLEGYIPAGVAYRSPRGFGDWICMDTGLRTLQ